MIYLAPRRPPALLSSSILLAPTDPKEALSLFAVSIPSQYTPDNSSSWLPSLLLVQQMMNTIAVFLSGHWPFDDTLGDLLNCSIFHSL